VTSQYPVAKSLHFHYRHSPSATFLPEGNPDYFAITAFFILRDAGFSFVVDCSSDAIPIQAGDSGGDFFIVNGG
jgi:hypothetical protein